MATRPGNKREIALRPGLVVPTQRLVDEVQAAAIFEDVGVTSTQRTIVRDCDAKMKVWSDRQYLADLKLTIGRPFTFTSDVKVRAVHPVDRAVNLFQHVVHFLAVLPDNIIRVHAAFENSFDCKLRVVRGAESQAAARQTIFNYLVREDHVIQT